MIVVMVLILNSLQSEAFPNGAPSIACRDLIPRHAPNQAADGPFPYEVDLSELALATYGFVYEAGRSYRSKLYKQINSYIILYKLNTSYYQLRILRDHECHTLVSI